MTTRGHFGLLQAATSGGGGGGTDPDFASVALLLHFDGTNGSTTLTDSSATPKTVTAIGNAALSTARSKFGSASLLLDGSGDGASVATGTDLALPGDFTAEAWTYNTHAGAPSKVVFYFGTNANNSNGASVFIDSSWIRLYVAGNVQITGTKPANDAWAYVAVTRASGVWRLWVNGVQAGGTYNNAVSLSEGDFRIGSDPTSASAAWLGNIDEVRLTKGVARDVSTTPTAAFPNA